MFMVQIAIAVVVYLNVGVIFAEINKRVYYSANSSVLMKFIHRLLWPCSWSEKEMSNGPHISSITESAYRFLMTFFWSIKVLWNVVLGIFFLIVGVVKIVTWPAKRFSGV